MSEIRGPSKILGYLYLGGKQDAKAKSLLQQLKIKYILNVTPQRSVDPESGCPSFFEKEKSFVYNRIPVFDNRGEDLLQYMDQSFRFIEEGKHYGGVLVHCHKGISRSSTFVIGYLMKKNEMSLEEALEFVKSIRPIIMPNLAFMAQLKMYEIQLDKERGSILRDSANASNHCPSSGSSADDIGPAMGPSMGPEIVVGEAAVGDHLSSESVVIPRPGPQVEKNEATPLNGPLQPQNHSEILPKPPMLSPVDDSTTPRSADKDGFNLFIGCDLLEPSSKKIKLNPA